MGLRKDEIYVLALLPEKHESEYVVGVIVEKVAKNIYTVKLTRGRYRGWCLQANISNIRRSKPHGSYKSK